MEKWIELNGSKMEKRFFEENLDEARSHEWEKDIYPDDLDHSHCLICIVALPEEGNMERIVYRSRAGWLCGYCHARFFGLSSD